MTTRAQSKRLKDLLRKHDYLANHPQLTKEQLNHRKALRWFIKISAFEDELEIVNTCTEEDNQWFLSQAFGVYDSAVVPSVAFDGCVLVDKRLSQR